ncbi:MAG: anti-toxin [Methylococcaceae bacterium]|nr:MAG: anti-toxin [Methylococcaceae bacterium]
MCESTTLEKITHAARGLPESLAVRVLEYIEDLADTAEADRRLADPRPAIPLAEIIREFGLDD